MPDKLSIIARPHPLSPQVYHCEFEVGLTIAEILGPDARACRVELGGIEVAPEWWPRVRPKPGHALVITRFPEGGTAKSIFRIIAFAALAVGVALVSGGTGSALLTSLGDFLNVSTQIAAGLAAATLGIVGSLVINALIPPQTPSTDTSSTNNLYSITGTGNQINRYGAVPCCVGTLLYYPPYAATPYTELSGDDQYLRCLFDLGSGDPDPADMQIGGNDLANYTDVQTEIGTNPSLFSQDITEEPVGVVVAEGSSHIASTGTAADEASIDLSFAGGLFGVDNDGNVTTVTVTTRVEFRPTGSSAAWQSIYGAPGLTISSPAAFTTGDGNLQIRNAERKVVRVGLRWQLTTSEFDVQVTRISTDWGGAPTANQVGDMTWTVVRTIRYGEVSSTGTKKLAMRIKATDQLSGSISQFSVVLSQPIPVWHPDTETWITEFSTNPAWVFRWLLTGAPCIPQRYRLDVSRVDDVELKAWAVECDAKEFCYSNALDQSTTLFQLLKDVCAAGRAVFNIRNGLYSVVRDELQTTPVQVFTPRNSWGFGGNRAFPDVVHALRVQFINPEANYQQDERIVYDDGYGDAAMIAADPTLSPATNFEQLTIAGCTNANAAWRLGRYHLAVARLRPNTYYWNTDIEHLVCSRGNLVQLACDVIGVGLSWGKVKSVITDGGETPLVTVINTDEEMAPANDGTVYAMRIRRQDGTVVVSQLTFSSFGEGIKTAALVTPVANINPDDLFVFGVMGQDVIPLVITKIEPSTDLSAKITAVDASFAVLDADAGDPPAWSSQITGQPWLDAPAPPSLVIVDSAQALAQPNDAGTTSSKVVVSVTGPWSGPQQIGA